MRSVRQYLFFEDEVHDLDVACPCQEVKEVSLVPGEGPEVDVGIVYEKLDTFQIVLQNGVVEGCVPFFAFEVYVIGVSYLFKDVLNIMINSFVAGEHQRGHPSLVVVFEVAATLNQDTDVVGTVGEGSVMDGPSPQTILHIYYISEDLK